MKTLFSALIVYALAISTVGCLEQVSHRSCPGFDDRSIISSWAPYAIGTEVKFSDQEDATIALQLESITNSVPYKGSGWGNDSSFACVLSSTYIFSVKDSDHTLTIEYEYDEFPNRELEDEPITAVVLIQETRESEGSSNSVFLFYLNPLDRNGYRYERDGVENIYYPSENIAGIDYQDVIDVKKLPGDRRPFNLPEDKLFRIKRVIFSRYAGITALEYEDGRLYTLVH